MESIWALLLAFVCVAAVALIRRKHPMQKLPPGPRPWPIIGNLNLLGSIPHRSLHLLSKKYGDMMLLKFGKFPVVVASSPEMAKQFLKTHDAVFASRPALAAGKYTSYNYSDMSWAPYGPSWRQARKIFLSGVFSARKLESSEHIRVEERRNFFTRLRFLSANPILLRDHLSYYALSIICRMVLGNKYFSESDDEKSALPLDELRGLFDEWFLLGGAFNIGDWIPWLDFLDLQGYVKRMKALHKKVDRFYDNVIEDHLTRRAREKDFKTTEDLVDILLQEAEDPNLEVKLTRDRVKALIQNLLVGGADTIPTTLEWTISEVMRQPRIIAKAKEELDSEIGRNRWVEENDFPRLPYVDAIIMESMRLHPIATLLAPHYAIEDCKVAGYDISKGTTVLINMWSIGKDPSLWDAPEEFLPERFMGKEVDVLGSNFALLPFGSGRRRCPGYSLGLKTVRTTLANMLHGFNLKLVDGMKPEDVSMEEEYGLTTHPKEPLSVIMEPTLPSHLY